MLRGMLPPGLFHHGDSASIRKFLKSIESGIMVCNDQASFPQGDALMQGSSTLARKELT